MSTVGPQRRTPPVPDLDERPLVAIWEVTRACDLRCLHCRASAMPARDPRELSTSEAQALIEQLAELRPGVLVLTGGDPLKRPDLFGLIERAVDRGLAVAITPSATPLLTTAVVERLAAVGISRIALSLDGPDAITHDGLRGVAGSFAATLAAIATVRARGLPLQINTSLTRATVGELPATGGRVAAIAPDLWSVFVVVPVGRASATQQLDSACCEAVFHFLYDWSAATGLAVKTTAAPAYRRVVLERDAAARRASRTSPPTDRREGDPGAPDGSAWTSRPRPLPINDGKGFIFVSHTGEVYPSGFLPLSVGNVRRTSIATIYRTSPLLHALRSESLLAGKCAVCAFRGVCGGSRARAYAATGSLFAEDPACAYVPPQTVVTRDGATSDR